MVVRSMCRSSVHLGIILEKTPLERAKMFEDSFHIEVSTPSQGRGL